MAISVKRSLPPSLSSKGTIGDDGGKVARFDGITTSMVIGLAGQVRSTGSRRGNADMSKTIVSSSSRVSWPLALWPSFLSKRNPPPSPSSKETAGDDERGVGLGVDLEVDLEVEVDRVSNDGVVEIDEDGKTSFKAFRASGAFFGEVKDPKGVSRTSKASGVTVGAVEAKASRAGFFAITQSSSSIWSQRYQR